MIKDYAIPGFVVKSGARIDSVLCKEAIDAGTPVKLDAEGKAVALAAGDKMDDFFGIMVRDAAPFQRSNEGQYDGALIQGTIQVKVHTGDSPKRRSATVYYDPSAAEFTTVETGHIQIPAVWATNGQASECAEIEVFPSLPKAEAAGG